MAEIELFVELFVGFNNVRSMIDEIAKQQFCNNLIGKWI